MAFSESFPGFGNSTFNNLESQIKHAIDGNEKRIHNSKEFDIIPESPSANIGANQTKTRSKIFHNSRNASSRWYKSKSDSKLIKNEDVSVTTSMERFTQFFESDLAFSLKENSVKNRSASVEEVSLLRVSQIETDFDENVENAFASVFDAPVCSEDIRNLTDNETEGDNEVWQGSIKFSKSLVQAGTRQSNKFNINGNINENEIENVVQLDTSSFICPVQDEQAKETVKNTLEASKLEIQQNFSISIAKKSNSRSLSSQIRQNTSEKERNEQNTSKILPTTTSKDLESLKHIAAWNLPSSVLGVYEQKGIVKMFDWQINCLSNPKVLFEHCNLVYSAPTSAGKTLVSEILLLKTVLERNKKALMILPFISVVREKMFYLQDLLTPAGYRVEGFFGGYTPPGGFDSINVAICTIEKANSIINKLLEHNKLDTIGTVVVDEIHLISDPGRGYILELLLAKILFMSRKYGYQIQIITMSATLANVELLKRWLDAELFITNYRPVALQEMIKIGTKIYNSNMHLIRDLADHTKAVMPAIANDVENVAQLCLETILESCSVIVFCPSKDWCEKLAIQLASVIHGIGKNGTELGLRLRQQLKRKDIVEVKRQLREIPTGLDSVLEKTITYGCAYHHAGLTTEERDIVESSFKSGALKIIVATSTLSSGVNLPARRVLIRTPLFGGKQMNSLTYKQMIGRAGRTGKDTLGESILICTEATACIGRDLVTAELKPITSCLELDGSTHLKRALLEVISSGVATSKADIQNFVNCTLLSAQKQSGMEEKDRSFQSEDFISEALEFLIEYEFVRQQINGETGEEHFLATRLGLACLASSMPPTDGLILFSELQKSRRCFVLESELHAVYLVTPYSVSYQLQELDWLFFLDLWEKLSPAMKKVGELVGVKESFLVRAMRGQSNLDYKMMQIHKRFYTALALQELVEETPINVVAQKYKCARGMLQSLQQMASTFAGIVTAFCTALQWDTLSLIVSQFKERLFFGIHRDLIDLMRLPNLSHKRARALYEAGVTTLYELAQADVLLIEKVLHNCLSFDSAKQHENENSFETAQRNHVRNFFITGKTGLTVAEAAKFLIGEARQFVEYEIGAGKIKWTQETKSVATVDLDQLHMSCEDNGLKVNDKKRKSFNESKKGSPKSPKLSVKNEQPNHLEKEFVSNGKKNYQIQEERSKLGDSIKSVRNVEKEAQNKKEAVTLNSSKERVGKRQFNEKSEIEDTENNRGTKKLSKCSQKENSEEKENHMKGERSCKNLKNNESRLSETSKLHRKKVLQQPNGKSCMEQSKECLKNFENPTLEIPVVIMNKNVINENTADKNEVLKNHEVQSTSNKVREDLKIFSNNDKNKENNETTFLIPKPKSESNSDFSSNSKQTQNLVTSENSSPNYHTRSVTRKSLEAPKTSKTNSTSNEKEGNNVQSFNQQPRRSPRNHSKSLKLLSNVPKTNAFDHDDCVEDLFGNDDSFELNSGINAALDIDVKSNSKHVLRNTPTADEIPCSQDIDENPNGIDGTPRQASRLLRSFRTQRTLSPLTAKNKERSLSRHMNSTNKQSQIPTASLKESAFQNSNESINISAELSATPYAMQMNASHILSCTKEEEHISSSSFNSVEVIDICGNLSLFERAFEELFSSKRFGFCLGVQQLQSKQKPLIGSNLLINQVFNREKAKEAIDAAVQFQIDDSNFLAGIAFCINENVVLYMNLQAEACDELITFDLKSKYLHKIFENSELTLVIYEARKQLKLLRKALPNLEAINVQLEDPKVANWLLQPDQQALSLKNLCQQYAPECVALVDLCGGGRGFNSHGIDARSAICARIRCTIEACVVVHIVHGQTENLERIGSGELLKFFQELEMPLQLSLCNMEIIGFPTSEMALRDLFQKMLDAMKKLETKIFSLHGQRFNLGSTQAVAKVLGLHRKSSGRISTSRQVLEKIDEPIAQFIILYRKLSVTMSKNIQPLLQNVERDRIHGQSDSFTATGRIAMKEPNLQNVAKDFEINFGYEKLTISCRRAFFPNNSTRCLISADFCQLEMRILAHMAKDAQLLNTMSSEKDVFTAIAAGWNKIKETEVSEQLRNGTKQICYGIIYGMGMRALAEALKCTEDEAKQVSEQFHIAYPAIRLFTNKIIIFARRNGYIETIQGRRRYLENINSEEINLKNQAERQAVNSAIQGSAADIAKKAILRAEKNIQKYRPKLGLAANDVQFVLHVHDELIFEVPTAKAKKIAKVLSLTMETCTKLDVPLKVKIKMGRSWGEMKEIIF